MTTQTNAQIADQGIDMSQLRDRVENYVVGRDEVIADFDVDAATAAYANAIMSWVLDRLDNGQEDEAVMDEDHAALLDAILQRHRLAFGGKPLYRQPEDITEAEARVAAERAVYTMQQDAAIAAGVERGYARQCLYVGEWELAGGVWQTDPVQDWCISVTERDIVRIYAGGDVVAERPIPHAYAALMYEAAGLDD